MTTYDYTYPWIQKPKSRKNPKSINQQVDKLQGIQTMKYYSAIKSNELLTPTIQMNLKRPCGKEQRGTKTVAGRRKKELKRVWGNTFRVLKAYFNRVVLTWRYTIVKNLKNCILEIGMLDYVNFVSIFTNLIISKTNFYN